MTLSGPTVIAYSRGNASRSAGVTPLYGGGDPALLDRGTAQRVRQSAGDDANGYGVRVTVRIGVPSTIFPSRTVVKAVPPLADPEKMEWSTSNATTELARIRPVFSTVDQYSDEVVRNSLLAFAVLLGVAASGLIATVQVAWQRAAAASGGQVG